MRTAFNYLMFLIAVCMVGVMLFPPPSNKRADYCEPAEAVAVEIGDLNLRIPLELEPSVKIEDTPRYYHTNQMCVKKDAIYCCKLVKSPIRSSGVSVRIQYGERFNYDYVLVLLTALNLSPDEVRTLHRSPGDQEGPLLFGNPTLINSMSLGRAIGSWGRLRVEFNVGDSFRGYDSRNHYIDRVYKSVEKTLLATQSQASP